LCKGDIDKVEGHRLDLFGVRAILVDGEGREDIDSVTGRLPTLGDRRQRCRNMATPPTAMVLGLIRDKTDISDMRDHVGPALIRGGP
jgi:hypothetical protein